MGNCIRSENKVRHEFRNTPVQIVKEESEESRVDVSSNRRHEESMNSSLMSEEERILEKQRKREENERKKQLYNLGKLRLTLHNDMETFLLNNILFSVQFFENFNRDRRTFSKVRLEEQSQLNAEGPGGGLSSLRHKKRASLPDTMQETVGRWVRLDPPIINTPTGKTQYANQKSRYLNSSGSVISLNMGKELLAPLRIMVVHEDVRVVEAEEEGLFRAIIPEPSKKPGYVKLRCVGNWEDESSDIYNIILRDKDKIPEASEESEESPYPEFSGSERIGSEYSYSCKKLYDKSMAQDYGSKEQFSSYESEGTEEEEEDSFDMTLMSKMRSTTDIKKKKGTESISQRPPMLPPHDAQRISGHQNADAEELNASRFLGKRDGKLNNPWYTSTSHYPRFQNQSSKMTDPTSKEADNWKRGLTPNFGNIPKGFNHSPKPSISTENSDSDYGYATIPPSYSPPKTAKRHGGIPLQCLTNVRYRRIESNDEEEHEELQTEGEQLARRIEGNMSNLDHLFITKTFLNPSEFLKAFGEEVRWRENSDLSSTNATISSSSKASSVLPPDLEQGTGAKKHSRNYNNDSLENISMVNQAEFDDDSLQARLGIPAGVPVVKKGMSWYSQRDRCGMRFPIEIIPSITIPWPKEVTIKWRFRDRKKVVQDLRTNEKRREWPGNRVLEASRTHCHAIAPPLPKNTDEKKRYDHLGWKLCFCEAERFLEEDLTPTQTRCLLFMLLLRRYYMEWESIGLSHNFVRTAFYWQCEGGNISWPEEEMANNLRAVIEAMYRALGKKKLPHYFIERRNIAVEESKTVISKAMASLHSMREALSVYAARAISGLKFSDSRVPMLNFKRLVEILTDDNILRMLNPALFGLDANDDDLEDDEVEKIREIKTPEPSTSTQQDFSNQKSEKKTLKFNPPNMNLTAITGDHDNKISTQRTAELFAEFTRIGKRYEINPEKIVQEDAEPMNSTKTKTNKVIIVKSTGTISGKKANPKLEASDAFARLKKADKEKQWNAQYRKELELAKKKREENTEDQETTDIFAKAEAYNPKEIAANPEKRRLLLSLFAKHFAHLGRRCGRDWGAIEVADAYLRHAENLTILLAEHEGYNSDYDDSNEDRGEAIVIMNEIVREFDILTNLRTKRLNRNAKIRDSERFKNTNNGIGKDPNLSSSLPDLNKKKGKSIAKPLESQKILHNSQSYENHLNASDEDFHF